MSHIMPTYFNRLPVAFERGEGVWLWDTEGNKYLDTVSGIAVCSLGHCHPAITEATSKQAATLVHTSNNFGIPNQEKLAKALCEISGMEQAYFCNSGAEANESALKLTRIFAKKKNIEHPVVITMKNSFHGRSLFTLCASGTPRIQKGFEPLIPGFIYADFGDITALSEIVNAEPNAVAIMLEPIQGDGGVRIPHSDYLKQIRELCDEKDLLLIFDEVQTGMARTGEWFASQYANVLPDILTVAKALGNGFPISSCLTRGKAANLFSPGQHGTTFGGSPLGCAIALAVIETMKEEHILQNTNEVGNYLLHALREKFKDDKRIVDIRGRGLMIGVELDRSCLELTRIGLNHHLLLNITSNSVIRLLPALTLSKTEADLIVEKLAACLEDFWAEQKK